MPEPTIEEEPNVDMSGFDEVKAAEEVDTFDAKAAAASEEKLAAQRIANQKAMEAATAKAMGDAAEPEEALGAMASKGREYLLERLRQHAETNKPVPYVPPPMSDRMRVKLEEEQAAGRKSTERHEAQVASRPVPVKTAAEGFTTPVFRPNDVVPDPKAIGHGAKTYSPTA